MCSKYGNQFIKKICNIYLSIQSKTITMKYVLQLAVIVFVLSSCRGDHFTKKVAIQNNTLTLTVDVENDKQDIDYQHSFDITDMTKQEQKALVQHIYDSLGVK